MEDQQQLPLDILLSFLESFESSPCTPSVEAVEQVKGLLLRHMQDGDEIRRLGEELGRKDREVAELHEAVNYLSGFGAAERNTAQGDGLGGGGSGEGGLGDAGDEERIRAGLVVAKVAGASGGVSVDEQALLERKFLSKWSLKVKSNEKVLEEEVRQLRYQVEALNRLNTQLQSQMSLLAQERDGLNKDIGFLQTEMTEE